MIRTSPFAGNSLVSVEAFPSLSSSASPGVKAELEVNSLPVSASKAVVEAIELTASKASAGILSIRDATPSKGNNYLSPLR